MTEYDIGIWWGIYMGGHSYFDGIKYHDVCNSIFNGWSMCRFMFVCVCECECLHIQRIGGKNTFIGEYIEM